MGNSKVVCRHCEVAVRLLDWIIEKLIALRNRISKRRDHGPKCLSHTELAFLPMLAITLQTLGFGFPDRLHLSIHPTLESDKILVLRR